jgi:hypothetical protein
MQSALFHTARADPKTVAIKEENLHPVSAFVGEQEQVAALWILL